MHPCLKPWAALPPLLLCAVSAHAQQTLDPVVVTATRQETRESDLLADVTVIDRAQIERSAGTTVADLLSRQPGIQITRSGGMGTAAGLFVRGANADQTKVLVDGIPINSLDAYGSSLRDLPLDQIERIEILRGPASTLYGADALGGVIQVITRQGEPGLRAEAFAGYGTQDTFQSSAAVSAGEAQWRLRFEGNRMSTRGISARTHASNYDADRDGYENTGGAFSLAVLPVEGHEVGFSYRQNDGRSHYDGGFPLADGDFNNRTDFRNAQWRLYAKNRLASFWNSTLQYGQATDRQIDYSAWQPEGSRWQTENRQVSWQNDVDLPLGRLLLAAERLEQHAAPSNTFVGHDSVGTNSALAGWTANWGRHRWQLNARRDNHSAFGGKTTYAVAYGYQITSEWRAHASYGTAFKAPSLGQLYNPSWGGNANLKPEQARNREFGIVWERGAHSASATYYQNRVRDLISWAPDFSLPFGGQLENVNRAKLEGVTLAYAGRFGDWRLRASYDWLDAIDQDTGLRLGRRARNKGVAGVSHVWGPAEAGVEWVGVGSRYDGTNGNDPSTRLGGYSLVNLTARYAISKSLSVEGRIDNLFDKDYELAQGYGTPGITAFVGIRYAPR